MSLSRFPLRRLKSIGPCQVFISKIFSHFYFEIILFETSNFSFASKKKWKKSKSKKRNNKISLNRKSKTVSVIFDKDNDF